MMKGICAVCGCRKSAFIKQINGQGVLNNIIGKLPIELHLPAQKGEYVPNGSFNNLQKYSYCGPGTKYKQRVKEGYKGINELDSMCKLHDQFYNENLDTSNRNVSDAALSHTANEIANDSRYDLRQRQDAKLVEMIMKNKAHFGLGLKQPLNFKQGLMKKK